MVKRQLKDELYFSREAINTACLSFDVRESKSRRAIGDSPDGRPLYFGGNEEVKFPLFISPANGIDVVLVTYKCLEAVFLSPHRST